jgi:hypothetical protein
MHDSPAAAFLAENLRLASGGRDLLAVFERGVERPGHLCPRGPVVDVKNRFLEC